MYKSSNNKQITLDNVNLKEEIKNMKGIAIMLEQDDGTYIESSTNTFPTDMKFNSELSGCIDNLGNRIENSLTYENGIANVETSNTSYCYLYFDIKEPTAADILIENVSSTVLWKSTLEDDGYRYVGTNPDNYVCFGTTSQSECTSDTDKYMYRIIGIFEDSSGEQHLKLIKKEALNTVYAWHSDSSVDTDWDSSDLYKGLNESYFLTNATYSYMQDSTWSNKIATWDYISTNTKTYENTGLHYYYNTVRTIYLHEMNRNSKTGQICYGRSSTEIEACNIGEWEIVNGKISLMYASDYLLSLGSIALDYTISNSTHYQSMKTGWMHITNNDSASLSTTTLAPPSQIEWTMSRYGFSGAIYYAWLVNSTGVDFASSVESTLSARPVFYLTSDVKISGEGTSTSPYIIS